MNVVYDATKVEIDVHRWYATIQIQRPDGTTVEFYVCADSGHSGLWWGDPSEHEAEE